MAATDKFFCTAEFDQKFPLAFVSAKPRVGSDHVPLILNFGIGERKKPNMFRFEKWWLQQPDFKDLVKKVWNIECIFTDPLDICQFKVRLLRKKVKGWAININAEIRKQKQNLLKEFDILDIKRDKYPIPLNWGQDTCLLFNVKNIKLLKEILLLFPNFSININSPTLHFFPSTT